MNRYTFEELTVGQTESYSVTVTEDMLAHFFSYHRGLQSPA